MRLFCFSDIHGQGWAFDKIMDFINSQSQNEEVKVFFLGDACDRGPDGYRIMNTMLDDERFIYIKGNHEDMFVNAAREFLDMCFKEYWLSPSELYKTFQENIIELMYQGENMKLYLSNGGAPTFEDWIKDGARRSFVNKISNLEEATVAEIYFPIYVNYDMCHAGCLKEEWNSDNNYNSLLWNRTHFWQDWEEGRILIHGHTPVRSREIRALHERHPKSIERPCWYANNTKLDIDTGVFVSGVIYLFDMIEQKFIEFRVDSNEKE